MLLRSLIVVLVVLNLGVAAWWILHDTPAPRPLLQQPGVPRLQLRAETQPPAAQARPSRSGERPPPAPARTTACTGEEAGADGWRVFLPPQADAAAADAIAERIAAAGFSDYLVMREGAEANAIALGRYGTREAAQRRTAALQSAGFAARCARIPADTPA